MELNARWIVKQNRIDHSSRETRFYKSKFTHRRATTPKIQNFSKSSFLSTHLHKLACLGERVRRHDRLNQESMHHAHDSAQASTAAATHEGAHLLLHQKLYDISSSAVHGALFGLAGSTTRLLEERGGVLHGHANKLALHITSTTASVTSTTATTHHVCEHLQNHEHL
jgi:hypothetical protein